MGFRESSGVWSDGFRSADSITVAIEVTIG